MVSKSEENSVVCPHIKHTKTARWCWLTCPLPAPPFLQRVQFCVFTLAQRGVRIERWELAYNGGRVAFAEILARARPGTNEAKGRFPLLKTR